MIITSHEGLGHQAKKARGCMKSQSDVAKKAGWGLHLVSRLELGTGTVSLICSEEIFQALGYKLTYILERNNDVQTPTQATCEKEQIEE